MRDAISTLREERAALRARLGKIEDAIAEYERWATSVQGLLGDVAPARPASDEDETTDREPETHNQPKSSPIEEFEEAVRLVLGEADAPLQRGPLLSAIERLGIVIVSSNPANAMATRLSRMDDIVNVKGEGYWLSKKIADHSAIDDEHGQSLI